MILLNPFSEGCFKLKTQTLLCIKDYDNTLQYLPIYDGQQSYEPYYFKNRTGRYCDRYVFTHLEGTHIPDKVIEECDRLCSINHIVYRVVAEYDNGQVDNLGIFIHKRDAKKMIDSYSFISNINSFCRSINCRHITVEAMYDLIEYAQRLHPSDYESTGIEIIPKRDNVLGGVFWGMVVILNNAPWTHDKCREYQKEMEKWQFDSQFIDIILAAGSAGVNTLIFDDKAETLQGLPLSRVYLKDRLTGEVELDHYWRTSIRFWNTGSSYYMPLDLFKMHMLPATEEDYLAQEPKLDYEE